MSTRGALPSKAKTKAYWRSCFILFLCLLPWRKVETSEECEASVGGNLGQVAAERRPVKEGTTPGTPISLSFDWCINRKSASTLTNICCLLCHLACLWPSQVALVVKNLSANSGDIRDVVQSLGLEDPLEKKRATHSSILAWKIPVDREAW